MTWTRENIEEVIEDVKATSTDVLREEGEVPPSALVFMGLNPETGKPEDRLAMVAVDHSSPESKQKSLEALRSFCKRVEAVAVLHRYEVWMRTPEQIREVYPEAPGNDDFYAWCVKRYDEIRERVTPLEAIVVIVEHGDQYASWMLTFARDKEGKPLPGDWQSSPIRESRFLGLLPDSQGD